MQVIRQKAKVLTHIYLAFVIFTIMLKILTIITFNRKVQCDAF